MKLKNVIDKIEKSKNLIELIIMFITAICTVIGVYLGFAQINSTLKEQRFSNRLELADDLMSEYMTLSSHGSKAVFYLVADANGEADELIWFSDENGETEFTVTADLNTMTWKYE